MDTLFPIKDNKSKITKKTTKILYDWGNGNIPKIAKHSEIKLSIIYEYIRSYIRTHANLGGYNSSTIHIADLFAGGGIYTNEEGEYVQGSPLRILQAVEDEVKALKEQNCNMEYRFLFYFNDKDQKAIDVLKEKIKEYQYFLHDISHEIHFYNEAYPHVLREVGRDISNLSKQQHTTKAIFILDQYGIKNATLDSISYILSSYSDAEVIFNLSVDNLINFLNTPHMKNASSDFLGVQEFEELKDNIKELNKSDRTESISFLASVMQKRLGSNIYFTPFYFKTPTNRGMMFTHVSKHEKARNVMMSVFHDPKHSNRTLFFGNNNVNHLYLPQDYQIKMYSKKYENKEASLFRMEEEESTLSEYISQDVTDNFKSGIRINDYFKRLYNGLIQTEEQIIHELDLASKYLKDINIYTKDGRKKTGKIDLKNDLMGPNLQLNFLKDLDKKK